MTTPLIGRITDRCDKLNILGWFSLAAAAVVLVLTNLPRSPVVVVADGQGRLTGYSHMGIVAAAVFGISFLLAGRLRSIAPHAAKPVPDSELIRAAAID